MKLTINEKKTETTVCFDRLNDNDMFLTNEFVKKELSKIGFDNNLLSEMITYKIWQDGRALFTYSGENYSLI